MKKRKSAAKATGREPLTREVYDEIRKTLFLNDYPPGHKLDYRKMAAEMNMSPTPLLQALKHMELLGLVRHEPNRGFFIVEITPREVEEAYAVRESLELSIVPAILANLDAEGTKRLKQALDEYCEVSRKGHVKLRMAKDFKFHLTLAELSGRSLTVGILRYLFDFSYLRSAPGLIYYRPDDAAGQEHREIYSAVMARDESALCQTIRNHIRNVCRDTMTALQQKEPGIDEIDF